MAENSEPRRALDQLKELRLSDITPPQHDLSDPFRTAIRANHRARDITQEFTEACQHLKTGQLVKRDSFSLWDSVQALEIMDPKMDSGFVPESEAFDTDYDVGKPLLPGEVIYIMDQLFCREMAWLRGYALFQTLFTSRHIYHLLTQPRELRALPTFPGHADSGQGNNDGIWLHFCLRAYCIAIITQCDMVLDSISSQQYYEEEDLNTQTYQVELLHDVPDQMSLDLLGDAISWLESADMPSPAEKAIASRLKLRETIVLPSIIGQRAYPKEACKINLQIMKESQHLASPSEAAFNPRVYRKLSISGPTREAVALPLEDACNDLYDAITCAEEQADLLNAYVIDHTYNLRASLWHLAARKPPPSALARTIWQVQLFVLPGCPFDEPDDMRRYMLFELKRLHVLPDEFFSSNFWWEDRSPSHPHSRIATLISDWMEANQRVYLEILRAFCMNRSRMRRCLVNSLQALEKTTVPPPDYDISSLYSPEGPLYTARGVDSRITLFPYLRNTLHRSTVVQMILQLGLEHDIYAPHEFAGVYHLLNSNLAMQTAITSHCRRYLPSYADSSLEKKTYNLTARYNYLMALADATSGFQAGWAAILRLGLLPHEKPSEEVKARQYELRSRDFPAGVFGAPVSSAEFWRRSLFQAKSVAEVLDEAAACLDRARVRLDRWAPLEDELGLEVGRIVIKSCIELQGLAVKPLSDAVRAWHDENGSLELEEGALAGKLQVAIPKVEDRAKAWWVVPTVKPIV